MSYAPHRALALEKETHRVTSSEIPLTLTAYASPLALSGKLGEKDLRENFLRLKVYKGQLVGGMVLLAHLQLWEDGKQRQAGALPCFELQRRLGHGDEHLELLQHFIVGHAATWQLTMTLESALSPTMRVKVVVELGHVWGADGAVVNAVDLGVLEHSSLGGSMGGASSLGATSSDAELSLSDALSDADNKPMLCPLRKGWRDEDEDYDADEDFNSATLLGRDSLEAGEEYPAFSPEHDIEYADHGSMKYNIKPDAIAGSPGSFKDTSGSSYRAFGHVTPGGPDTPGGPKEDDDFGFIQMEAEAAEREKQNELLESQRSFARSQLSGDIKPCPAMQAAIKLWPSYTKHTVLTYPMHRAIIDMNRSSKYKDQVFELGLIRPFLLLVSMHPEARISWAKILNVDIWDSECSGDSHQEAWEMLVGSKRSLQSRLNCLYSKQGDWYQLLFRVSKRALHRSQTLESNGEAKVVLEDLTPASLSTWKETFAFCSEPYNNSVMALEEIFLRGLVEMFDEIKSDHQIPTLAESTKLLMAGDMIDPLVSKLQSAGFKDTDLIRRLAATTYEGRVQQIVQGLGQYCGFTDVTMSTPGIKGDQNLRMANLPSSIVGLNLVLAATPMIALSPLIVLPALALTGEGSKYDLFHQAPYEVLLPIIGICSQREMLAYQNICVDDFYPASMDEFVPLLDESFDEAPPCAPCDPSKTGIVL